MSDQHRFRILRKRIPIAWVLIGIVISAGVTGYLGYDVTRKTSVCDAQSHPDVAYAFQLTERDDDGFVVFERGYSKAVYEVRVNYSPPREDLQRDMGWRRVPSGEYLELWGDRRTIEIYPHEDYAKISEYRENSSEVAQITDCAGGGVLS